MASTSFESLSRVGNENILGCVGLTKINLKVQPKSGTLNENCLPPPDVD